MQLTVGLKKLKATMHEGVDHSYHHTTESAHGQIEIRQYSSVPVEQLGSLPHQEKWLGLRSVGMVMCERRQWT